MANEIKAVASLDDRLSPGISKIEANVKKFGFEVDGVFSKLARSFSATDIAVGVIVGSMAKLAQTVDKTATAYLAQANSMDPVIKRYKELDEAIKQNDIAIGKSTSAWKLFWKEREKEASDFLDTMISIRALMPGIVPGFGRKVDGGPDVDRLTGKQGGGIGGGGLAPAPFNRRPYSGPFATPEQTERMRRDWQAEQGRGSSAFFDNGNPYPWSTAKSSIFNRAGRQVYGPDAIEGPRGMDFGNITDPNETVQREYEKLQAMAAEATAQLTNSFSTMFSNILNGSQNVGDAIKSTFAQLVRDMLAQMAGRAVAGSLISLIPGLGPILGATVKSGAVAIGPAAASSSLDAMNYRTQRGAF